MNENDTVLKYIGNGSALVGVPARDLTEADLKIIEQEWTLESLINSKLYEYAIARGEKKAKGKKEGE